MKLLIKKQYEDLYQPHEKVMGAPISKGRIYTGRSPYNPMARSERYYRKKGERTEPRKRVLDEEKVFNMRKLFNEGVANRHNIAEMFNVSYASACKVIAGDIYPGANHD